jgi:tetratricopeptide (TPR) repeat protein
MGDNPAHRADLSYEVLGRRAEAIADFRKALLIDPANQISKQQLRVFGF